jgi:ATP-binding cassette subfamily B protein
MVPAAIASTAAGRLGLAAGLVVLFAVLTQAQKLSAWLLQTYTGERLSMEFRAKLLRHAQRLSLAYHDAQGSADAVYRIQYDAPAIQWVAVYGITPFITAVVTLIGMIVVTALLDWQIAVLAVAASPVLFMLTHLFRKRLREVWTGVKEIESSALSIVHEILAALRVVKAFGQEDREQGRFVKRANEGVFARLRVVLTQSLFSASVGITIAGFTAAVLYLGVTHLQAGVLTLGQLLLVMAYLAQLYGPLQAIGQQVATLQGGLASAERAFKLLDEIAEVRDRPGAKPIVRARGEIAFDNVDFSYDGRNNVLQDVNFRVAPGLRVGIIGRTGMGKTTLLNLLLRFSDPSRGVIRLDGVDLRDYRLADLRDQFAVVLQEPILFSCSIEENIAYGRPTATSAEVVEAARAAHADEFVRQLPEGYQTLVGERGMRLSGGERQRIALARAFLKECADSCSGRTDQLCRCHDRGLYPRCDGTPDARPHYVHHRPSVEHARWLRSHAARR